MQLNFSAPKSVTKLLKATKGTKSLSRHILEMVMDGLDKNFPLKKGK